MALSLFTWLGFCLIYIYIVAFLVTVLSAKYKRIQIPTFV